MAWRGSLVRFGAFDHDDFDPDNFECMGIFYGYPYHNLSLQRVVGVRMPGASPDLIDLSFFGTQEGTPPYEPDPRDDSPEHTERVTKAIGQILTTTTIPRLAQDAKALDELRDRRPDAKTLTDDELWEHARPLISSWYREAMEEHMFVTAAGSVPIGIVQQTAAALGDPGLAMRALGGLGDVASAAPTYEMWDLSRLIRNSPTLTTLFNDNRDAEALDKLHSSTDPDVLEFLRHFNEFLHTYGSRCPNEFDLAAPSWETDPAMPLTAIERMRLRPDQDSPRLSLERLIADRETTSTEMLDRLADDPESQAQFRAGLAAAKVWLPAREYSKFNSVRLINEARLVMQELGRRMVERGVFDAVGDFAMVTFAEFPEFVANPASFSDVIRQRKARYTEIEQLEPPFITIGAPPPPSQWRRRVGETYTTLEVGEVIRGIPACPGVATGTARVIRDPADGRDIEPGDVLIAPFTDPAWTPCQRRPKIDPSVPGEF